MVSEDVDWGKGGRHTKYELRSRRRDHDVIVKAS